MNRAVEYSIDQLLVNGILNCTIHSRTYKYRQKVLIDRCCDFFKNDGVKSVSVADGRAGHDIGQESEGDASDKEDHSCVRVVNAWGLPPGGGSAHPTTRKRQN